MPAQSSFVSIAGVRDSRTWAVDEILLGDDGAFASCWIAGLGENADTHNVRVLLDGVRLANDHVGEPERDGVRQVNVRLPVDVPKGLHDLTVTFGSAVSAPCKVVVR
jgi:uncharacterized protein (TIGR03437 family)